MRPFRFSHKPSIFLALILLTSCLPVLMAEDSPADFAFQSPPETPVLVPLTSPELLPYTLTVSGVGLTSGLVTAALCLQDLVSKSGLGFNHPSVQADILGAAGGVAFAGLFAVIIDIVLSSQNILPNDK
jgi:hypothetical protein